MYPVILVQIEPRDVEGYPHKTWFKDYIEKDIYSVYFRPIYTGSPEDRPTETQNQEILIL